MPVYESRGRQAFFTIIEDGQAIAVIRAELAGKTDSFNKAWVALFNLAPRDDPLYGVRERSDHETQTTGWSMFTRPGLTTETSPCVLPSLQAIMLTTRHGSSVGHI